MTRMGKLSWVCPEGRVTGVQEAGTLSQTHRQELGEEGGQVSDQPP